MPPREPLVGRHPKRWDDMDREGREASIQKLMAAGHGATAIAAYHGTTRNVILGTVHRAKERGVQMPGGRPATSSYRKTRSAPRPRREREKNLDLPAQPFDPSDPASYIPKRSKSVFSVAHSNRSNARPPTPLAEEAPAPPDPAQAVDMAGLSDKVCAFPLWPNALNLRALSPADREAAVRYCGMGATKGHYCLFHHRRMHEKTPRQEFAATAAGSEA